MAHLVAGLVVTGLGLWGIVVWWGLFGLVMRGLIPFLFLFFGLIAILASARRLNRLAPADLFERQPTRGDDSDDLFAGAMARDPAQAEPPIDESAAAQELVRRGLVPTGHAARWESRP